MLSEKLLWRFLSGNKMWLGWKASGLPEVKSKLCYQQGPHTPAQPEVDHDSGGSVDIPSANLSFLQSVIDLLIRNWTNRNQLQFYKSMLYTGCLDLCSLGAYVACLVVLVERTMSPSRWHFHLKKDQIYRAWKQWLGPAWLLQIRPTGWLADFPGRQKKLGVLECHLERFRVSPWNLNSFLCHWTLFQLFRQNVADFVLQVVWEALIDLALHFYFVDLKISSKQFWRNLSFFWWLWAFTAFKPKVYSFYALTFSRFMLFYGPEIV
jgi:hypothetical protein